MKAFGFRPKLYTALKNYSKELFMADLMAGIPVCSSTAIDLQQHCNSFAVALQFVCSDAAANVQQLQAI